MESAIPSLCLAILSANSEEVDRIVKTHGSSMLACPISHRQITLDPDVTQLLGSSTTGLNILQFSIAIGDDAVMDEELDEATLSKRKEIALRLIEVREYSTTSLSNNNIYFMLFYYLSYQAAKI